MAIEPGDSLRRDSNTFIDSDGERLPGLLLARTPDKTEAIILSLITNLGKGIARRGGLHHVREVEPELYPEATYGEHETPVPEIKQYPVVLTDMHIIPEYFQIMIPDDAKTFQLMKEGYGE